MVLQKPLIEQLNTNLMNSIKSQKNYNKVKQIRKNPFRNLHRIDMIYIYIKSGRWFRKNDSQSAETAPLEGIYLFEKSDYIVDQPIDRVVCEKD